MQELTALRAAAQHPKTLGGLLSPKAVTRSDEEIIMALRDQRGVMCPVELAELLGDMFDGGLQQGALIVFFRRAFEDIPLRVMLDACSWHRVTGGLMTDDEFNRHLHPWLGVGDTTA